MSEQQQELSLEEKQEAQSAFAAGYPKVRGEEPPTDEPARVEQAAEATAEEQKNAEAKQEPEPETPIYEGLTPSQLKAKLEEIDQLKQENRKAFGKVGELNSRLQQFNERLEKFQQQPEAQRTPAKLKRLSEEFPDLAEALSEDLAGVTQGRNAEEVDRLVDARVATVKDDMEMKLFTFRHPDWNEIRASDELEAWEATLPPEEAQAMRNSRDATALSKWLDTFKTWREDHRKQQAEAQAAEQRKAEKRQRIEAAATTTNGAAPPSGEKSTSESFRAGYDRIARARQF